MTSALTLTIQAVAAVEGVSVSDGITVPSTTSPVPLGQFSFTGVLIFNCAAGEFTGTSIEYVLAGGDFGEYDLSSQTITITSEEKTVEETGATPTIVLDTSSTPTNTKLNFQCPDVGYAITWFAPITAKAPPISADEVEALYAEHQTKEEARLSTGEAPKGGKGDKPKERRLAEGDEADTTDADGEVATEGEGEGEGAGSGVVEKHKAKY